MIRIDNSFFIVIIVLTMLFIIQLYALSKGINGHVMQFTIPAIVGIGTGYITGKIKRKGDKKNGTD